MSIGRIDIVSSTKPSGPLSAPGGWAAGVETKELSIRNKDYTLSCGCTNESTEVGPAGLVMSAMFEAGPKRL